MVFNFGNLEIIHILLAKLIKLDMQVSKIEIGISDFKKLV